MVGAALRIIGHNALFNIKYFVCGRGWFAYAGAIVRSG
jgi:hypothetical protein